jgi:hypothetical protein
MLINLEGGNLKDLCLKQIGERAQELVQHLVSHPLPQWVPLLLPSLAMRTFAPRDIPSERMYQEIASNVQGT